MTLPDPIDQASHHELMDTASAIEAARKGAAQFEPGAPGNRQECGKFFSRIVRGMCCRCRDLDQR
jgi:hypothetical protein